MMEEREQRSFFPKKSYLLSSLHFSSLLFFRLPLLPSALVQADNPHLLATISICEGDEMRSKLVPVINPHLGPLHASERHSVANHIGQPAAGEVVKNGGRNVRHGKGLVVK